MIGTRINGARLWVQLGPLQFQPGELAKIALIVFLAGYLREKREVLAQGRLKDFGPLLAIWGAAMLVLVETNDLGSALLYFGIFLAMLYVATGRARLHRDRARALRRRRRRRLPTSSRACRSGSTAGCTPGTTCTAPATRPCRGCTRSRTATTAAPGFGRGTFTTTGGTDLIPYVNTDFIYSALAQELGLIGAAALLLVYMVFVLRGFRVAAARRRRLLEAARRRADVRLRAPDLHHRRRPAAGDPADRHHAPVRQLRRLERGRELHPARGPPARLQPGERTAMNRQITRLSAVVAPRCSPRSSSAPPTGRPGRSPGCQARQDNAIQRVAQFTVRRGLIYSADGRLLAARRAKKAKGQTLLLPPLPVRATSPRRWSATRRSRGRAPGSSAR